MIRYSLHIERLGPLPLINHFIARMGLDGALARHVPSDQRCVVPHARALGVLLGSIIGRALDRWFDADRSALLTDVVLAVGQTFALKFDEFHNDSTTVSYRSAYRSA